jgi:hypothetical protein
MKRKLSVLVLLGLLLGSVLVGCDRQQDAPPPPPEVDTNAVPPNP